MKETHQTPSSQHYSETPMFRAALCSLSFMGLFLFLFADFVIGFVLKGQTIVALPSILILGAFIYASTLVAFEPKMNFKLRVTSFAIGVAAALPLMFAVIYAVIHVDFSACISTTDQDSIDAVMFRYFSFTTFTTLGYGDVRPIGICRELSSAEAILGLIYMGTLVAVISEAIASRRSQD